MAYAIIRLGGKQFKVQEGDTIKLERQMELNPEVLMFSDGDAVSLGLPTVSGITVKLSKVEDKRDRKVVVARFKSKSRYRKVNGHRQPITIVKVDSISSSSKAKAPKAEVVEETEKVKKAVTTKKTTAKKETKA